MDNLFNYNIVCLASLKVFPKAKHRAAECKNYASAVTLDKTHVSIIPAPERLLLSTLDLLVVEDTDVVEETEFSRILRDVWDMAGATRDEGAAREALVLVVVVLRVVPDIPVPERFDTDEDDVVLCIANERVGVDRFPSSLLVLPEDR